MSGMGSGMSGMGSGMSDMPGMMVSYIARDKKKKKKKCTFAYV